MSKYLIVRPDGVIEIRWDSYSVPVGAILITNEQYNGLVDGTLTYVNGQFVPV